MTVQSQLARADYLGDGITTTPFTVTFRFLRNTHLKVLRTVIATNVTTELILDSLGPDGFSVTGAGQPSGGVVTTVTAPPVGTRLSILRDMPFTQLIDYIANDPFPAESHETGLDERTMENGQLLEVVSRAITIPPGITGVSTDLPGPQALYLLRWNAAETALENAQPPAIATVADGAVVDATVSPIAGIQGTKINFLQVGVGAVVRTMQNKLNEETSVTDFMSDAERADIKLANPLLDHTVSIQKAFTAAALGPADSRVRFPRGRFNVSGTLLTQFSGVIYGAGTQDTIIRTTHATNNLFSTVGSFGCLAIRDLQINTTVPRTGGAAIYVNTTLPGDGAQARLLVNNVAIYGQYKGIEILNASYWHITKCWFYECVQYGIYSDCTSNFDQGDNSIEGNLFTAGNTTCEHVRLINNCRVLNNKMLGGAKGVMVEPSAAPGTRVDFQIFNNSIENQATHGIHFRANAAGVGIANSQINDNQIAAFQAGSQCIAINGPVGGLTISDNLMSLIGINSAGIALVGNAFGAPGTINCADNVITGGPAGSIGIFSGGGGVVLNNNMVPSAATRVQVAAAGTVIRNMDATFAEITTWAAGGINNGSVVYCSNGTIANPVAGAGTGCIAKRLNGVWVGN